MAIKINDAGFGTTSKQTQANVSKQQDAKKQLEIARQSQIKALKQEIETLNDEIKKLKEKKSQYGIMKTKIGEATSKLKNASDKISTAKLKLQRAYVSKDADGCKAKMDDEMDEINGLIGSLNNTIVPAIDTKIREIDKLITNKQTRLRQLHTSLMYL